MSSKTTPYRRRRTPIPLFLIPIAILTAIALLVLELSSISPSVIEHKSLVTEESSSTNTTSNEVAKCATVEEMGGIFSRGYAEESLRVRGILQNHFAVNGAAQIRQLPPHEFCKHGFVIAKASEAGFGNEMYKILTAAALSVMLNRSLIIGQTRHIEMYTQPLTRDPHPSHLKVMDKYPFGDYISYSNSSFTLEEVKHLWRQNHCLKKYGRHLTLRIDDFLKPVQTNVLCSNWKEWQEPIIWLQNTTDAVAAQFFLKNVHSEMREAASGLFGRPENLQYRANVFGELMRILISPSRDVEQAVNWALKGGKDPDIALHMRMMMNRSVRAGQAAVNCIKKAVQNLPMISKPKVVLVSDNPDLIKDITPSLEEFAEVLHFDYKHFGGNISGNSNKFNILNFRKKDWGPAPRWVAFVDFFLASRAKHAIISGAHRRVGTTYAQLIAALAAAYRLDDKSSSNSSITFLSSFQSNLLSEGLSNQVGWGHVWNRFAGSLSCHRQPNQCALTPVLPPAWWDGLWQSPTARDVRRMNAYGIRLSGLGTFDDKRLNDVCFSKKNPVVSLSII